jgi:glc operon protein GlcG
MDGAKFLSIQTAQRKAVTAADRRAATGGLEAGHDLKLSLVTDGRLTNLKGGLPIVVGGQVLGAVGVSSGSGEEDLEVARAGVAAIPGARTDW